MLQHEDPGHEVVEQTKEVKSKNENKNNETSTMAMRNTAFIYAYNCIILFTVYKRNWCDIRWRITANIFMAFICI